MEELETERPENLGSPMPEIVVLEGSPTQIGAAHGRMLAPEIRLLARYLDRYIFRRVEPALRPGLRVAARTLASILGRHTPALIRDEIREISKASGVPYTDLLLMNTLDDVLNILRRLAPTTPSMACSSFVVFGDRTRNGELLHGRNLDYHFTGTPLEDNCAISRLLIRHARLFAYHPDGGAPFISIAWPGVVGVTTAMNQAGLSLGNLTSYLHGTTPFGVPTAILYRGIAEQCTSLRDVGELLRAARRTIGNNFLVSSGPENRAVLFEITADSVVEVTPKGEALIAANHFVSQDLARRQRPYLFADSLIRWERLDALCGRGDIGVDRALTILADAEDGGTNQPFARIANDGTAVSALFHPAAGELWIGVNPEPPASGGGFRRVDAAQLLNGR